MTLFIPLFHVSLSKEKFNVKLIFNNGKRNRRVI